MSIPQKQEELRYIGPSQFPPDRTPPISEVGFIGWLRSNLFGNWVDAISSLITIGFLIWFIQMFIQWALTQAQWEVIFLNLANLGAGPDFPKAEIWRIEVTAYITIALIFLSIGFWGRLSRWIAIIMAVFVAISFIVPPLVQNVESPPLHYYLAPDYPIRQINFVADEGDNIRFEIVPLLQQEQFAVGNVDGYIEDDNDLSDSAWITINEANREIRRGNLDPSLYDLNIAVQIRDANGELIAESDYTQGSREVYTFEWTAPDQGWYTTTAVINEDAPGDQGQAWLRVQNLPIFYSTIPETNNRIDKYGEPPEINCPKCATSTNRTDMQYRGERTPLQWFSLQLAPFLVAIQKFLFIGFITGLAAYTLGQIAKRYLPQKNTGRVILALWVISLIVEWFLVNLSTPELEIDDYGGLFLTLLLSSVAIIASFPIGVALALGRQSDLPIVKYICTFFIEVVRGVPLITLLFAGRYIVPFFVDGLQDVASAVRMTIVLTFFSAAYLAEVVRGGLQIVPPGQIEAARALGLSNFHITSFIILPQALRAVIPAIMGVFVSLFKDTSLVALIGLYEVLGAMRRILQDTQTGYAAFQREGYLYIGIIYFIFSYLLAVASRRLEHSGSGATRSQRL